jgi:hypothetical protein
MFQKDGLYTAGFASWSGIFDFKINIPLADQSRCGPMSIQKKSCSIDVHEVCVKVLKVSNTLYLPRSAEPR